MFPQSTRAHSRAALPQLAYSVQKPIQAHALSQDRGETLFLHGSPQRDRSRPETNSGYGWRRASPANQVVGLGKPLLK